MATLAVARATFPPQPRPLVSGLGTLGRAGPRVGPVFYRAFETNAVEPPLIPPHIRKPETHYRQLSIYSDHFELDEQTGINQIPLIPEPKPPLE